GARRPPSKLAGQVPQEMVNGESERLAPPQSSEITVIKKPSTKKTRAPAPPKTNPTPDMTVKSEPPMEVTTTSDKVTSNSAINVQTVKSENLSQNTTTSSKSDPDVQTV
ncbi:unnamed protein product, partial [Owenia fusiformis]